MEEIIMNLIVNGGDARSRAMMAIHSAKAGEIEKAKEFLEEASEYLHKAHDYQTNLIQNEAAGNKTELSLLMVHAQDHLMNAMTIRDLAQEFVDMYELINNK
ncbi:lichenan-specific phosphotransferase enzyme IIA component [Clostridiales bacterium oral taxon 876 str. F0540]|nr:lichenan-specific phosphotransferase enzyme IIA component [Clostridiales bacterium oral taxon 876 str. F0540]